MENSLKLPADDPARALFIMDGDYMQPWIRAGEETLVRQYAEDSFGTVYLFVLDRTQSALDRVFPKADAPVCLGTLLLDKTPPLPLT